MADTAGLYTHPDCGYSDTLREELIELGAAYEEIDLALHPEAWAQVEKLTGGTLPAYVTQPTRTASARPVRENLSTSIRPTHMKPVVFDTLAS